MKGRERVPMNVSLTPELEKFVSAKVESGRYNSASEIVREALRLWEEHDSVRSAQLVEFNEELGRRLAALDHGGVVDPAGARAAAQVRAAPEIPRVSGYVLGADADFAVDGKLFDAFEAIDA
jgi:antitoxin ParD1/3/4